jgi:hypothetical protein
MFNHIWEENNERYFFKEKLSNNQTLEMNFIFEDIYIFVTLAIFSKREYVYENRTYGKLGIKPLLIAKTVMELFIDYMHENQIQNKKIIVRWADNRRRNVYYRGLKKLGFNFLQLSFQNISFKCLCKTI